VSWPAGWIYAAFSGEKRGFSAADDKMIYYKRCLKRLISILAVGLLASVVNAQPVINQQPISQLAPPSGTATLSVAASGTGPLTYQWRHNGTNLPNGIITTVAGNGALGFSGDGDAATNAALASPSGVAVDGAGNLYIADYWNSVIRDVDADGVINIAAGLVSNEVPVWGYSGDGGAATNAELDAAISVGTDVVGDLFIADYANNRIREVDTSGFITTVAGSGGGGIPGMALRRRVRRWRHRQL
jgi:hypothetical protein